MNPGGKYKKHNSLWLARKRAGLRQKQVAHLLGHRTVDQVSRYEKGTRLPTLETALMLEIIYRTPLRQLFSDLYEELHGKIRHRVENISSMNQLAQDMAGQEDADSREFCTYADRLRMPTLSPAERAHVHRHITKLARKLVNL
jgi:transcriptional regulator with XRE-family HTH domain